jgi:hypothetical protein
MVIDRIRHPAASWRLVPTMFFLAAAVVVTSVAAAGPAVTKQRVAITIKGLPNGSFVLTPFKTGALKRDSGTTGIRYGSPRVVVRDGQKIEVYSGVYTFDGRRGSFTVRERNEWRDTGSDGNGDGNADGVAVGTWKAVRGTGEYAGVTGGGGSAHAGLGNPWNARLEGFLTNS